jgi:CIC family chloride channel protein
MISEEVNHFRKTIFLSIIIGIISGFGALLFFNGIKYATRFIMGDIWGYNYPIDGMSLDTISNWSPPTEVWLFLPIICLGALISGFLVYRFAPEAEGHGTDAAIAAFHTTGRIRRRIPIIKALSSLITISTGGSAGREGPTAQIAAGFGSIAADFLKLPEKERRIAIASGIGAGVGTIFKAPLGGAILAAEILYLRDFESDAIVPAFLSSIIGYGIFGYFEGYEPIFARADLFWSVPEIPLFVLLGVVCAIVGIAYVVIFDRTKSFFKDLCNNYGIPLYFKPVIGAACIGLLVITLANISPDMFLVALGSIGSGYGFIQLAIFNMLPLTVLLLIPITRIFTTSLTIGSGGSGGVFAPGLAIGAATGGAFGMIMNILLPDLIPITSIPVFAICGMIALFGGISHAPIACLIMIVEMVGDLSLLVPAMGAVAASVVLVGNRTIYKSQIPNKTLSGAHRGEFDAHILQVIPAREAMTPRDQLVFLSPDDPSHKIMTLLEHSTHYGYPVINKKGFLVGLVTVRDKIGCHDNEKVENIMVRDMITAEPETDLETILKEMISADIGHIPIVEEEDGNLLLKGVVTRRDITRVYAHKIKEEY